MRLVPKFEDAFKETLVQYPTTVPDRRYLELYESPELNFIGRPFEDMARFHAAQLGTEGMLKFLQKEAHEKGVSLHDLADRLNKAQGGPGPPGPPGPPGAPGRHCAAAAAATRRRHRDVFR